MTQVPIDLADQGSWPDRVRNDLQAQSAMFQDFEAERRAIDCRLREDVPLRANPPNNPRAADRSALIASIDAQIAGANILAWHCTRLLPHESAWIADRGLRRHCRALFDERIDAAVSRGHLTEKVGTALLANGQVEEVGRDKLLHFILNRQILADEPAVADLLLNWGGEAIYNNAGRGRLDLRIGEAKIIEVAFPIAWLHALPWSIGAQIVMRFCDLNGIETENRWGSDAQLRRDLPPTMLRQMTGPSDRSFAALTNVSNWDRPV